MVTDMTNNINGKMEEGAAISEKRRINLGISFLEDSVKSCDASRSMNYIRYVDRFSNIDSLIRYNVDHLKAIEINRQTDKKVKELIDKFFMKCKCTQTDKKF